MSTENITYRSVTSTGKEWADSHAWAERGIVTHNGIEYAARGAMVAPDRLVAYLADGGRVTTWEGATIGAYTVVSRWPTPWDCPWSRERLAVRITLDADHGGRQYHGRSFGEGMIVFAYAYKGQERAS